MIPQRLYRSLVFVLAAAFVAAAALLPSQAANAGFFEQTNLVSDIPGLAGVTDPNLVNSWGISFPPMGPFWISDNGKGKATVYNASGQPFPVGNPIIVTIPPPSILPTATAAPTGNVFNSTTDFGGDRFLFATEDGTISGWSGGTSAVLHVDNMIDPTTNMGPVYKGLALASTPAGNFLYAANFRDDRIDVFDKNFTNVTAMFQFKDPTMPPNNIPAGFAPFDIKSINGQLYVTYAKQNDVKHDDVKGPGNGFVDIFNTDGTFVKRLISNGPLNSPWGLAVAPADFGPFSDDLLVGNFGDGLINAFDPSTGTFFGTLKNSQGNPISIDGLWGLTFGNGFTAGPTNTLFFTAGINGEANGLFGDLVSVPEPATLALMGIGLFGAAFYSRRGRKNVSA
jgi:uncharacterized protein (TIGR03118 family)